MIRITVFTPTYNRAHILSNLYTSLLDQSNKDFLWLVVDDGSIDSTEQLVTEYINEGKIRIRYLKQRNMGKHAAHNTGVMQTDTELFVCVDSDDTLIPDAIKIILEIWDKKEKSERVCGIIGPRSNARLERWPKSKKKGKSAQLYEKYKFIGDTMMVFRSDIIKQYLFPVFAGEKYIPESVVYQRMDLHYEYIYTNEVLYIGNYLDDGLSQKTMQILMKSPRGTALHYLQTGKFSHDLVAKVKGYACYYATLNVFGLEKIFSHIDKFSFLKFISKILKKRYIRLFKMYCEKI